MISILFSFRGRVTRADILFGVLAWFAVIVAGAVVTLTAMTLGHRWAGWTYVGVVLIAMVSMQAMAAQRAHDVGESAGSWFMHPFTLFGLGMVGPNAYGASPPRGRLWWFLGALVVLGFAGSEGFAFVINDYADTYCTPYVIASAVAKSDAELLWRQAVSSKHGADHLTGNTAGYSTVCHRASARSPARPAADPSV